MRYVSRLTLHVFLLPARGQDGLHLLRPLINRLVPRQSGLLCISCHRLIELVHLRVQQRLPVATPGGSPLSVSG